MNYPGMGYYPPEKVDVYAPYPSQGSPYPMNPSPHGEKNEIVAPFPPQTSGSPHHGQAVPALYQMGGVPYQSTPNPNYSPNAGPSAVPIYPELSGGSGQPAFTSVQMGNLQETDKSDASDEPQRPSAPPLRNMDSVSGYEDISFDPGLAPPPSYDDSVKEPTDRIQKINYTPLTEEEVREALLEFVSRHCCYGKKAARNLTFSQLEVTSNFHYILETFTEKRSSAWAYVPFDGNPVDGPMNGPAPGPWDIPVETPPPFKYKVSEVEVPHTASVKQCHTCLGNQRIICKKCTGMGVTNCSSCSGKGQSAFRDDKGNYKQCTWCQGRGKKNCSTCNGSGQVQCPTCAGKGQLKCYIKLTVTWETHRDDYILKKTTLSEDKLREVSGNTALEEQQVRVWPVRNFPEQEINDASIRLLNEHGSKYIQERIIMQRQTINVIPVIQVHYSWKQKEDMFYVSGVEKTVNFENYPQKCCWGCTIF